MKVAFVVNDLATERPSYTTIWLARECANRGHDCYVIGVADFAITPEDTLRARATRAPAADYETTAMYLDALRGEHARVEDILVDRLDILMLRSDPGSEAQRPWARYAGVTYGLLAMRRGVIVLNCPRGLATARDKQYLQYFPPEVRPTTLTTRDAGRIEAFVGSHSGPVVLKPTAGSGGRAVFLARPSDSANLHQMIEAVRGEGYVVAQEYLPEIEQGDIRLLMMNGAILERDGVVAAFRRKAAAGEVRSNLSAGGEPVAVEIDGGIRRLAELARPRLVQDGMFLVGLDIVGDKLMEINIYSPGGLSVASELSGVDFAGAVVDALERKTEHMRDYHRHLDNAELAIL